MTNIEPDLVALHDAEDPRRLSGAQRDELARQWGKSRAYVDALIDKIAVGYDQRDPNTLGG